MRKVFPNTSQAIHVWSQQNQNAGRAGNVSFDGPTLFSYSTPIAHFMARPDRPEEIDHTRHYLCVLHTAEDFSVTTQKHKHDAVRATRHYESFIVPYIGTSGGRYRPASAIDMHVGNMQYFVEEYKTLQSKAYASSVYVDSYIAQCAAMIGTARKYAAFFGLEFNVELFPLSDMVKLDKAQARQEKANIKREAKRKREEIYRNLDIIEKVKLFLAGDNVYLPYNWHSAVDSDIKDQVHSKAVQLWRNGQIDNRSDLLPRDKVLLRLRGDTIFTSWGAQFPTDDARKVFKFIQYCHDAGVSSTSCNVFPTKLGSFKIDNISETGDVKSGCHFVLWSEVLQMAKTLGLIENKNATD